MAHSTLLKRRERHSMIPRPRRTHWGWYWKIKKQHKPRRLCSGSRLNEIDSFEMYKNYELVELVRLSADKCSLSIPRYDLKAYLQDDNSLFVKYAHGSYIIPVEQKPCNYGGHYYFFHCPLCKSRMRKLYCVEGQYQCRCCGNLSYYKQRTRPSTRWLLGRENIKDFIKNRAGDLQSNLKPPRMHRKTFEKLKAKAEYYDAQYSLALNKELRYWYGPRMEPFLESDFEFEWDIKKYKKKYGKARRHR